ncbi:MAG: RNA polymerase factor sigma-54 [Clostridiales bacterium]|nr:RNA polymerase factor sigma-54 [Clostridiales bacterium]
MKMNYGLNLIQTQKLVLTPELRQAIEILQYNSLELNDHIKSEMMENPLLETVEDVSTKDIDLNIFSKKYFSGDYYEKIDYEEKEDYVNIIPQTDSLINHLEFQLQFTVLNDEKRKIALFLIENINDNGYLKYDEEHVIKRFKVSIGEIEEIVQTIQTFEPVGVGARNIRECLLIQLEYLSPEDDLPILIVKDYIDDLASNRLLNIAKSLDRSIIEVQNAVDFIRKLEPKPGRLYSSMKGNRYIKPDVTIMKIDGEYTIVVNDYTAPKLRISRYYKELMEKKTLDPKVKEYIQKKIQSSLYLIKSIEQRKSTIYKVVEAIIDYQGEFFSKGRMYLKTMTLKDIAETIDVHESTVSRAVSGKYLQSPSGLYELKYFFQSGVNTLYGEGVSSETIKMSIKEMIDKENPTKPISDQQISNELNLLGIKISRRTIAKYRDDMGISGSSKRKRFDKQD